MTTDKKIIINGKFLTQRITGVQRYAHEIIRELDKIANSLNIELVAPQGTEFPSLKNIKTKHIGTFKGTLWEQLCFPWYVVKQSGISLNLCNAAPLLNPGIVCLHDVKIKAHPEFFSWKFLTWYKMLFLNAAKRAKKIITVSDFSKNELIKYYGISSERITVIPNAWQHFERIGFDENALNKYTLQKDNYFFSMSSMEPNKNFKWIAEVAKRNPNYMFAIAGSINGKVFADGLGFECPENMKLLGYVSDKEAKTLMRDCKAFLFPTFYEGFGIPPLEAVSAGCNSVVVSDIPVMREIFEDEAVYVNTKKVEINLDNIAKVKDVVKVLKKYDWQYSSELLRTLVQNGG